MDIKHEEYSFKSKTGVCQIYSQSWVPQGEVRAVVQIHHGMAETSDRYEAFAKYLCGKGFAVFIHDMANHGKSNQNREDTGYFGEKDGWLALVEDMKCTYDIAKKEFPKVPYFVFGHSMGSFVTRCFLAKYASLVDGAIICGTSGKNPLGSISIALSDMIAKFKGSKYKSKLLDTAGFGSYNKRFEGRTKFDWLTRDNKIVDEYINDEMCGFMFSAKGFGDLSKLLVNANSSIWYEKMPKELPICLISGEMDPVGNYGKGITEIYQKLKSTGHNVTMKLYAGCRHEILNETVNDSVFEDVANYFDNVIDGNVKAD